MNILFALWLLGIPIALGIGLGIRAVDKSFSVLTIVQYTLGGWISVGFAFGVFITLYWEEK